MRRLVPFVALPLLYTFSSGAEVVRIGTLPGLKYDVSAFSVKPGTEVEVIFTNSDEMLHNFVVTKPGRRLQVVQAAVDLAAGAAERQFVPSTPDVLWAMKVTPSGQSSTLKFTAPNQLGEYPYVCTFPGHGFVMFGTMIVTANPQPPVMTKLPPSSLDAIANSLTDHHHDTGARITRFFMPNAGPASIAVQLPGGVSYCWDAGACRLRYVWTGGYIERPDRGLAKIIGDIVYNESRFPLWTGATPDAEPHQLEFKGYTLDAEGIPEFETSLDGITVRERIEVRDARLVRRFRTDAKTIWFAMLPENEKRITTTGVRDGDYYKFTGTAAQEFTITLDLAAN